MLFNSFEFAVFLPVVFCLYWLVAAKSSKRQNLILVAASYFFYGWWDWRFLSLIAISSFIDYHVGLGMGKTQRPSVRRGLLILSLVGNLGLLGFFKYFNFFIENFVAAFHSIGIPLSDPWLLQVILPVGISFYTFQTLSYSIDVYNRKLEPTQDWVAFFAFVSFFPQLVAGPIERAGNLLPQFRVARTFEYGKAVDGMRQILWGFFKKVVIADNCAVHVNDIFNNYPQYSGSTLLLGAVLFAFQIYGDFSGYSDIAIGTARLFGVGLMRNFAFPYFSRDIAEFWRRWHISLSTWFRDYVYIPLGGSRGSTAVRIRNILIIFILSGFWHGANWTFILWGALNAMYFLPLLLRRHNRTHINTVAENRLFPSVKECLQMGWTFSLTLIAWIVFRSESGGDAVRYMAGICSPSLGAPLDVFPWDTLLLIGLFVVAEWIQRNKQHGLELDSERIPRVARWSIYYVVLNLLVTCGGAQQDFIYFQF